MIIENTGIKGLKSELSHLDEVTTDLGFVRWQWEYYRATYDLKIIDKDNNEEYFLRINARVVDGKMESKYAVLSMEDAYIGRATFPHGLDYNSEVPKSILDVTTKKLSALREQLI
jgi:CTP:phosphocholine cytidylyltransferase-like protein